MLKMLLIVLLQPLPPLQHTSLRWIKITIRIMQHLKKPATKVMSHHSPCNFFKAGVVNLEISSNWTFTGNTHSISSNLNFFLYPQEEIIDFFHTAAAAALHSSPGNYNSFPAKSVLLSVCEACFAPINSSYVSSFCHAVNCNRPSRLPFGVKCSQKNWQRDIQITQTRNERKITKNVRMFIYNSV